MPAKKPADENNEAIQNALLLELERRAPETYDPALAAKAEGALDGLLVKISHDNGSQEILWARAVRNIREWMNTHDCTRKKVSDPPCQHPDHWKDVAAIRDILMKAGLPGDLSLLPLAYADEEYERERRRRARAEHPENP